MTEQHPAPDLDTQRVNDYLRSFKTPISADDTLENYLLEKAALALQAASSDPSATLAGQDRGRPRQT
jgi:hypothetical protein